MPVYHNVIGHWMPGTKNLRCTWIVCQQLQVPTCEFLKSTLQDPCWEPLKSCRVPSSAPSFENLHCKKRSGIFGWLFEEASRHIRLGVNCRIESRDLCMNGIGYAQEDDWLHSQP